MALFFLFSPEEKSDWFPSTRPVGSATNKQRNQAQGRKNRLIFAHAGTLPRACAHISMLAAAAAPGTVEEVSGLAGEAACVTPAVGARRGAAQTHTPARVLVGALRTMSATPASETERTE